MIFSHCKRVIAIMLVTLEGIILCSSPSQRCGMLNIVHPRNEPGIPGENGIVCIQLLKLTWKHREVCFVNIKDVH